MPTGSSTSSNSQSQNGGPSPPTSQSPSNNFGDSGDQPSDNNQSLSTTPVNAFSAFSALPSLLPNTTDQPVNPTLTQNPSFHSIVSVHQVSSSTNAKTSTHSGTGSSISVSRSQSKIGPKIGGSIGGVVLLISVAALIFLLLRRRKRKWEILRGQLAPYTISNRGSRSVYGRRVDMARIFSRKNPLSSPSETPSISPIANPSMDFDEPIYHEDAGRVEIPPAYENARSGSVVML